MPDTLRRATVYFDPVRDTASPAGVLIGFGSEDDWFEYKLQSDPRFLARIEAARASLRADRGVPLERLPK